MNETVHETRCLGCGGEMKFDPGTQSLVCAACGTPPETPDAAAIECPNCGAELTMITGTRQAKCGACDSAFDMLSDDEDCEITGDVPEANRYITPFTVTRQAYQKSVITWLAGEHLTPTDIFERMAVIRSEGYYIPYYHCIANYKVTWTASIGYDRTETFTEFERRKDSSGRIQSIPVTKTRVVTDWRPFGSATSGSVTNSCEASEFVSRALNNTQAANSREEAAGIKESSQGLFAPAGDVSIEGSQKFDAKYTAGFAVLPCDVKANAVYDKGIINKKIRQAIEADAPGDRIRDVRFSGDIVPSFYLVYQPSWISVYSYESKYGDKVCFSMCDGTDAFKNYGTRPIDKDKKRRIRKGFIPLIASLGALVLFLALGFATGADLLFTLSGVSAGAAAAGAVAGLVMRFLIIHKGKKILARNAEAFMQNPGFIFGRKSAKADPTASPGK